jgi:hypothetical protein
MGAFQSLVKPFLSPDQVGGQCQPFQIVDIQRLHFVSLRE